MSEETGITFGKKAVEQIGKTVREVSRQMVNETPHRGRWQNKKGGARIIHGIVTTSHGNGWYTIEKADWTGYQNTYEETDPFANVTGSGTTACAITLTIPASQLTGRGVYVTARDTASLVVPLIVGTDCLLTNLGDRDAATGEAIWQVVNGLQNLVVKYDEEWDCCNAAGETGVETLISRTPNILVGITGPTITCGSCTY